MPVGLGAAAAGVAVDRLAGRLPASARTWAGSSSPSWASSPRCSSRCRCASRLDRVWRIVRRAAGHEQREGALPRIFGASAVIALVRLRVLVPDHPGPGALVLVGLMRRLFGYYRQFDELSPDEVSRGAAGAPRRGAPPPSGAAAAAGPLRRRLARAAARRGDQRRDVRAAARGQRLPGRDAAAGGDRRARTTSIRRARDDRPRRRRAAARRAAGRRHGGGRDRLAGLGPAAPARAARRARRRCRSRHRRGSGPRCCAGPTIRPARSATSAPGEHWLILDEALAGFADAGRDLDHPRVIQVRSFSKAHAMAGLRIGYAIVPDGGPDLSPVLGVGAPALAARAVGGRERRGVRAPPARAGRRAAGAAAAEFPVAAGVGPYVWLALPVAEELAARRIYVAPGTAWGDEQHVRVTLDDDAATDRLLDALRETRRALVLIKSSIVPPERWSWLGEPLAIDFANTVRRRGGDYTELLSSGADLRAWAEHEASRVPDPTELARRRPPGRGPRAARRDLRPAARRRAARAGADRHREARQRRAGRGAARPAAARRRGRARRARRPTRSTSCSPARRPPRSSCSPHRRSRTATPRAAASSSCAAAATSAGADRPAAPARGWRGTLCGSGDLPRRVAAPPRPRRRGRRAP